MGSSCEGGQCRGPSLSDNRQRRNVDTELHRKRRNVDAEVHRKRRNVDKQDSFYDLLQGDADASSPDEEEEEEDKDDVYGHIIFTPHGGKEGRGGGRHRRSAPALMSAR